MDKTICIHICFFYIESRLEYIRKILEETNNYKYKSDIFIHTNVSELPENVLSIYKNGKIVIFSYDFTNEDPFYLSWKCRPVLVSQRNDYDIFMYIEDDILVPKKAIEYWEKKYAALSINGHNLGFLRIEVDSEGNEFVTDLRNHLWNICDINGNKYCINDENSYCAFWIYDKDVFNRWVESSHYDLNNVYTPNDGWGYKIREASAVGLNGRYTGWYKDTVIPVLENNTLDPDCRIYHLPNNYIGSGEWARIPFGEVIRK